ncbi:unnamed protein product [Cuscuta campestris]|uniref:Uncharacterized protein n=1 Tax=Cuscuta campestris TaxID=132261 RepID=A0A484M8I1_9ASTE|nr:unnamed protein product [Cuscuta campestris]
MSGGAVSFFFFFFFITSSLLQRVEAASGSPVSFLPGFDGPLPFQLRTGYVGVGNEEDVQLFYYFIKSESNPEEDPLILWITGGPGCSPLRAIIQEIGPLLVEPVEYNGSLPRLLPFPYSWTKVASIIFLDLPVGTGFSYATTSTALHSDNLLTGANAYEFLQKWFGENPEFLSNPFYVGGDSYSGITVPILTEMISNGNREIKPFIHLQGYILGNPLTSEAADLNSRIPFAHRMALISDELYKGLKRDCKEKYYLDTDPTNLLCQQHLQTYNQSIEGIFPANILEPICVTTSDDDDDDFSSREASSSSLLGPRIPVLPSSQHKRSLIDKNYNQKRRRLKNPDSLPGLKCREDWNKVSEYWANDDRSREALHVRKGTKGKWEQCASNLPFTKIVQNSIPYHERLSRMGYRSLVYSGDHDMVVPYLSTHAWIKLLNYSVIDDWRPWIVEGQVAGYTTTYANQMTFATVKGGGHTAPEFRPSECFEMFKRWIFNKQL